MLNLLNNLNVNNVSRYQIIISLRKAELVKLTIGNIYRKLFHFGFICP